VRDADFTARDLAIRRTQADSGAANRDHLVQRLEKLGDFG
jgi:hypothetical protein